ncbi:GFA family protein [Phaeobacter sp. SYSU ZJ3003]|uniref:GFA family protein n=1 Tax=Phaeobacter sp. SYSU ZJ3003 TaxID=2109330 RepID=UPI00351C33FF
MVQGICCCGAVQFQLTVQPPMMGTCHCSRCRKVGTSAIVLVRPGDVQWTKGKDQVTTYTPEPPFNFIRCFCKICGTSLGEILAEDERIAIAASALDGDIGVSNQFHEFVADKADWYEICDDAPQYDGAPT